MKTLFLLDLDGIYTSIQKVEVENRLYKHNLTDFPDKYFKTFRAAKKSALENMTYILNEWKNAVKSMKAQTKENY